MTPFEVGVESELNLEQLRFANEWLFRWHNLNIEGKVVDVECFDGGRIHLGGIEFGDQQQSIYWQAIGRYLNGKVHSTFRKWDEETKGYPSPQRRSSLEGTSVLLGVFVAGIIRRGIKTDRAVRGWGQPKTDEPYQVPAVRTAAASEIERLKTAHLGLMPAGEKGALVAAILGRAEYSSGHVRLQRGFEKTVPAASALTGYPSFIWACGSPLKVCISSSSFDLSRLK